MEFKEKFVTTDITRSGGIMKKYHLFKNLKFSLQLLTEEHMQSAYGYSIVHIVLGVVCPLLFAIFPGYVAGMMTRGVDLESAIGKLVCVIAGILLLQMTDTYAMRMYEQILFLFRNQQGSRLMKKALEIPYALCESPEGQRQFEKARRAVYEGNENGVEMFLKQFVELCMNLLGIVTYAAVIGATSPVFLLCLFLFTVLGLFASAVTGKQDVFVQEKLGEVYTRLQYLYQAALDQKSAKDIRIYRIQKCLVKEFDALRKKALKLQKKSAGYYLLFEHLERILSFLRDVLVYGAFLWMMYRGKMTVEQFIINLGIVSGFNGWIMRLFENSKELMRNNIIVGQFREFLAYGKENVAEAEEVPNPGRLHTIVLEHVSFRYPGAKKECIHNLNLTIHGGEKLALVGINGAGKSTVVKLILGLYKPTDGRVLLDGRDISHIERKQYFAEIAVAFQEVFVFAASIADNVAGETREKQDTEQVKEKLDLAGLWEFVKALPKAEQTSLTKALDPEGMNLSGGQIQKLMLARTLYKNAPVVILDEPTAALDPVAEHELYQKYSMLTEGKTSIFISHRLSSTRFCDRILLFDQGKVVEEGTHEALLEQNGAYAKLYEVQAKYYRKEENEPCWKN